jgi:hypothetical protein
MPAELIQLLERREAIIADHAWRDRDAAGHLDALMQVSTDIAGWTRKNDSRIDARLRHYLTNASFAKALAHLKVRSDGGMPEIV